MNISFNAEHQISSIDWSSWINPYHNLETRITQIANQKLSNLQETEIADLKQGFKVAHKWILPAKRVKQLLATLPKETIQAFMFNLMTTAQEKEVSFYFENFLRILPKDLLVEMSGFHASEMGAALYKSRALIRANVLKNGFEKEGYAILREFVIELQYFLKQFLEIIIALTGINRLTRLKEDRYSEGEITNNYEAEMRLEMYWKFLACPITLFGIIYSYIEFKPIAALITFITIGASLTAIVAYKRYWKPCPIDCHGLKNLSIELIRQNKPIYPRRDILNKIESAFEAKKGVILKGEPGCGKSWSARSFVEQILAGKICHFITNPQVFSCNGTDLTLNDFQSASFKSIEDKFEGHNEKVVFFFDEFHSIFKKDETHGNSASEKIKTFCEDFKYVIGATTNKEFDLYLKDEPAIVERRFEIIDVKEMDEMQMKATLSQYMQSTYPKILFDSSVIDYIIKSAPKFSAKTSIIDAATSLINCAARKIESTPDPILEGKIVCLEDQLGMIEQQLLCVEEESYDEIDKYTKLYLKAQSELKSLKVESKERKDQISRMQKMESYQQGLKLQSYKLANLNQDLVKGSQLERKWLELHVRIRIVKEFVLKERNSLGLPSRLNVELVDSILHERANK